MLNETVEVNEEYFNSFRTLVLGTWGGYPKFYNLLLQNEVDKLVATQCDTTYTRPLQHSIDHLPIFQQL